MFRNKLNRFRHNERGVAAIEFGLVAPLFAFAGILVSDIGFAVMDRMDMDQSLRGAAQIAMANVTDANQLETAIREAFNGSSPAPTVSAVSVCECAGAAASCNQPCPDATAPAIFVNLSMQKLHQAILMPDTTLQTSFTVRLR